MTIKLYSDADVVKNLATPASVPAAATEAVLTGSQIVLPAGLQVGSRFKWRVVLTKTAAGTGNSVIKIKTNTTSVVAVGTTGGAATAVTLTFPVAETAAIGSAYVEIEAVVQTINATTGAMVARLLATSTVGAAVGFSNQQVAALSGNIATDGTIQSVGLTITSGAADAVTVNYVDTEFALP